MQKSSNAQIFKINIFLPFLGREKMDKFALGKTGPKFQFCTREFVSHQNSCTYKNFSIYQKYELDKEDNIHIPTVPIVRLGMKIQVFYWMNSGYLICCFFSYLKR